MPTVLGVSAVLDPAAALVDGETVARPRRSGSAGAKHGKEPVPFSAWELPVEAMRWCLDHAGLTPADVDAVAYSYDPDLAPPRARTSPTTAGRACARCVRRLPRFLATALPASAPTGSTTWPTTSPTPPRRASPRRTTRPRCWCWTGGASGPRTWAAGGGRPARRVGGPGAAPLAGPAVRAGYPAPGFPPVVRRVQGHGPGQLRRPPAVRARDAERVRADGEERVPRRSHRPGGAGTAPAGERRLGRSPRRPGGGRAGGSRRSCSTWPAGYARTGGAGHHAGRRGGAQLRGQRAAGGRGAVRARVGPARGRRLGTTGRGAGVRHPAGRPLRTVPFGGAGPGLAGGRDRGCAQGRRGAVPARRPGRPGRRWRHAGGGAVVGWFEGRSEYGPRAGTWPAVRPPPRRTWAA